MMEAASKLSRSLIITKVVIVRNDKRVVAKTVDQDKPSLII